MEYELPYFLVLSGRERERKKVMRYFPSKGVMPILHFIHSKRRRRARLFELLAGSHKKHICLFCRCIVFFFFFFLSSLSAYCQLRVWEAIMLGTHLARANNVLWLLAFRDIVSFPSLFINQNSIIIVARGDGMC